MKWNETLHDRLLAGLGSRTSLLWLVILSLAGVLRALLAWYCPRPDGYTYDFYFEGVEYLNSTGTLPTAATCWQCYHPPLFYGLGAIFYRAGALVSGGRSGALAGLTILSLISGCLTAWYSIKLLQLFRERGANLLVGSAVVLVFPCLFISSWSAEADSLQTAIMAAVLYYLTLYDSGPRRAGIWLVLLLGTLCGLAMATKYNGLLALAAAGVLLFTRLWTDSHRTRTLRDGAIILALALTIGSWKYIDNVRQHGTALFANGPAAEGFGTGHFQHWRDYDYVSLQLGDVVRLYQPGAPPGRLTDQPVYASVLTSLYAMAWTDMSFFSVRGRHGDPSQPYPDKAIPHWLVGTTLVTGLVPTLLAVTGLVATLRRKSFRACTILTFLTMASYVAWFTAQDAWALKTKYILYLLPAYATYLVVGLRVTRRCGIPCLPAVVSVGLIIAIATAHVFLYAFAVGALPVFGP